MENRSRGIVICAGGWRLPMTWAHIALLRAVGTTLPVEVWHLPGEMTAGAAALLRMVGAIPRLLHADTSGYWTMPHAIAETNFEEVLHLGSDYLPLHPLEWVFEDEQYLQTGALLSPDIADMRGRDWFPDAWLRLGLKPPACNDGVRCSAAWESDGAIMALNKRRCPGAGTLKELAADGRESGRYGRQGDKELYRLAWESVGCSVAHLPYPAIVGMKVDMPSDAVDVTEESGQSGVWFVDALDASQSSKSHVLYGLGSLHLSHAGEHLGIHWAWGKKIIQRLLPEIHGTDVKTLSGNGMEWWWGLSATFAPLDGYGDTVVDTADFSSWLKHLEGDENAVMYSVRLHRCHSSDGADNPCSYRDLPATSQQLVGLGIFFMATGRELFFQDCPANRSFDLCTLRTWLTPEKRMLARQLMLQLGVRPLS